MCVHVLFFLCLGPCDLRFDIDKQIEDEEGGNERVIESEKRMGLVSKLRDVLKPFLLRRTKEQVNLQLPPKVEIVVYTGMTQAQITLTQAIGNGDIRAGIKQLGWTFRGEDYAPEEDPGLKKNLSNDLMQLRKVCNHPYLFAEPRRRGDKSTGTYAPIATSFATFTTSIFGVSLLRACLACVPGISAAR